jgi:hypothetical protein
LAIELALDLGLEGVHSQGNVGKVGTKKIIKMGYQTEDDRMVLGNGMVLYQARQTEGIGSGALLIRQNNNRQTEGCRLCIGK